MNSSQNKIKIDYKVGDLVQWTAFADEILFGIITEVDEVNHIEGAWTYARTRFKVDWFEENHNAGLYCYAGELTKIN